MLSSSTDCRNLDSVEEETGKGQISVGSLVCRTAEQVKEEIDRCLSLKTIDT